MIDLADRLRVYIRLEHPKDYETHIVWQAADEIERLRKALQTISDGAPFDIYGEDQYYWCQELAYVALMEGKE